jgi:hypothetical protein
MKHIVSRTRSHLSSPAPERPEDEVDAGLDVAIASFAKKKFGVGSIDRQSSMTIARHHILDASTDLDLGTVADELVHGTIFANDVPSVFTNCLSDFMGKALLTRDSLQCKKLGNGDAPRVDGGNGSDTASVATPVAAVDVRKGHGDLMVFFIMLLDKLVRPYWEVTRVLFNNSFGSVEEPWSDGLVAPA